MMLRLLGFCLLLITAPVLTLADDLEPLVQALAEGNFDDKAAAIETIAATGDPRVAGILQALTEGDLYSRDEDGKVVIAEKRGRQFEVFDPLDQESLGLVDKGDVSKIRVNNRLRRTIDAAMGGLTLMNPDPATRLTAANSIFERGEASALPLLEQAIAAETDEDVRQRMEEAKAASLLRSEAPEDEQIAAIATLVARGDRMALSLLGSLADETTEIGAAADRGVKAIERKMAMWDVAQNLYYGISLGSVLLLAAIGLAITFGVMGVINMAHGEMVMLGAYVTFVVQQAMRDHMPGLLDGALLIALPLAFLITAAIGIVIERLVIRYLYGRPLETLLATWGLSLILQQAVRTIFGPTNREVSNPSWMSGAMELGGLTLTYNRLWIILFSLVVFTVLMLVMKRTGFGLHMRAVVQNRPMASAMGIRTTWVDALTFGLGSGIAGIAGVALSQIDNVSPNLGQGYIIDSFMVVVFGGVGNLWGTLTGALTLGVVNKFLEPYAGAVLGKILVLIFIILFIQKRPRGLFALRGRAVET